MAAGVDDRRAGVSSVLWLVAILGLGFWLRYDMADRAFVSTFDTSTPGLMALHILKGERPLFYYGQNYMGALEAYVAAVGFKILGPSTLALSLSPICFALLWILAMFLLFREMYGAPAGCAAALITAAPGWDTLWYTLASYGGYPAAFFFGTIGLWLVLILRRRDPEDPVAWCAVPALGLSAGLGLWTHYSCAAFLLTGFLYLLPWLLRHRRARALWAQLVLGGFLGLAGIAPVLLSFNRFGGGHVAKLNFAPGFIRQNIGVFFDRTFERFLFWPLEWPLAARLAVIGLLAAAVVLWILALIGPRRPNARAGRAPLIFCLRYAAMYLPHSLAPTGAPRYVIPMMSMIFATLFALPLSSARKTVRRLGVVVLSTWAAYNGLASLATAREREPRARETREDRNRVVQAARETGADTVMMIGGPIFGHDGQTLSFYANDDIRFVSTFDERYQPSAQAAEASGRVALACETPKLPRVQAALQSAGVSFRTSRLPWVSLLHEIHVPRGGRLAIPPAELKVSAMGDEGDGSLVLDRWSDSVLTGHSGPGQGFEIDLGRERAVASLWLFPPDPYQFGLPEGYTIHVSRDGAAWEIVREVPTQIAPCFTLGDRVYLKGYHGKQEIQLHGAPARFVRVECTRSQGRENTWKLSEIYVFEESGPAGSAVEEDLRLLVNAVEQRQLHFVTADRWLSARLMSRLAPGAAGFRVYPRFNPKFKNTQLSRRVIPQSGRAVAALREVAGDCADVLTRAYGSAAIAETLECGAYTLICLAGEAAGSDPEIRVLWNGHVLLESQGPEGLGY